VKRACLCCGRWFIPRVNVPDQQYCSRRVCQNARRRLWRKQKLTTDPDYKADQYAAQKRWCEKNPDYWKHYRASHPDYCQRNRQKQKSRNRKRSQGRMGLGPVIAKRYALKPVNEIISGFYTLLPVDGDMIAKRYALFVKLDMIAGNYINGP
jgi:hypothetical protein